MNAAANKRKLSVPDAAPTAASVDAAPKKSRPDPPSLSSSPPPPAAAASAASSSNPSVSALLRQRTAMEREHQPDMSEIDELLSMPTAREREAAKPFVDSLSSIPQLTQCPLRNKAACLNARRAEYEAALRRRQQSGSTSPPPAFVPCPHIHFIEDFRPGITRRALGECSWLDQCPKPWCDKVHYKLDPTDRERKLEWDRKAQEATVHSTAAAAAAASSSSSSALAAPSSAPLRAPEWLCCDIRTLDTTVLGKFSVIMMDPPWRIFMSLPYETMSDAEMLNLNIAPLQDHGVCLVWVIGRAQAIGRECLARWGYKFEGELLWVKMDQLARLKRTGRTGHWLNRSNEHCLIGSKGNLAGFNLSLDCDVILSQTRETSRKPDEAYTILERLSPGTRKLEIFGRQHNTRNNWLTLGNQLDGQRVEDPALRERLERRYGPGALQMPELPPRNQQQLPPTQQQQQPSHAHNNWAPPGRR